MGCPSAELKKALSTRGHLGVRATTMAKADKHIGLWLEIYKITRGREKVRTRLREKERERVRDREKERVRELDKD